MTRVLATATDAGKPCPHCRSPIAEGSAEHCDSCGSLHHEHCWRERPGCAAPDCSAGAVATPASPSRVVPLGPRPPAPSQAPGAPAPPAPAQPHAAPPSAPIPATSGARTQPVGTTQPAGTTISSASRAMVVHGQLNRTVLLVAIAIATLGAGGGAVAATGVLSGGAQAKRHSPRVIGDVRKPTPPPASVTPSAGEQASDRSVILSLLDQYQSAYSAHEASALAQLFSTQIVRHGLAAGGCTVSRGRSAVQADYESQFQEGSGRYGLVGLSAGQVQLDGKTQAHLDGHYRITPGGSGYVNFRFAATSEGWRISEVDATCE